jgi:hypothetical protein
LGKDQEREFAVAVDERGPRIGALPTSKVGVSVGREKGKEVKAVKRFTLIH